MEIAWWSAVAGLLLLVMAVSDSLLARLPLSTSMLYLAVGAAVSPLWLDWLQVVPSSHSRALERIAEVVLLLSLFGSGLKMSVGLDDGTAFPFVLLGLGLLGLHDLGNSLWRWLAIDVLWGVAVGIGIGALL